MAKNTSLTFRGDIKDFKKFIDVRTFGPDLDRKIKAATIRNSLFLIKKIKDNIRNREFDTNSELTLVRARSPLAPI